MSRDWRHKHYRGKQVICLIILLSRHWAKQTFAFLAKLIWTRLHMHETSKSFDKYLTSYYTFHFTFGIIKIIFLEINEGILYASVCRKWRLSTWSAFDSPSDRQNSHDTGATDITLEKYSLAWTKMPINFQTLLSQHRLILQKCQCDANVETSGLLAYNWTNLTIPIDQNMMYVIGSCTIG